MAWSETIQTWMRVMCSVLGLSFIVCSILLIYVGALVDNAVFQYGTFIISEDFSNSSRAAILIGVFMLGILWLQITGAIREWAFLMFLNSALLGYLMVLGVVLMHSIQNDEQRLNSQLYYGLLSSLKRYGENSEMGAAFRIGWSHVQRSKNCCGTNNYTDWEDVRMITYDPQVPISCCKHKISFCSDNVTFFNSTEDSEFIHTQGCYSEVRQDIPLDRLLLVIFPFEVIGILSVIMSAYLSWKWRGRGRENRMRIIRNPTGHQNLIEEDSTSQN